MNYTQTWDRYEAGKDYKRRIGLYQTVRENERFYRGEQWYGVNSNGLPKPVFNIIKRVIDYMISSVVQQPVSVSYSDESIPFKPDSISKRAMEEGIKLLNKNAVYRYDKCRMETLIREALLDAAISGDGVFYVYWDENAPSGQDYKGDIRTVLCDSTDLFVANVNTRDIQKQDYIIISGRDTVEHLCEEARRNRISESDISKISADENSGCGAGELFDIESADEKYATYLLCFTRDKNGCVCWEKSTRSTVISGGKTRMKRYPVACFAWDRVKGSFIGSSPITALIENQKYINKAYAMIMKHMTDTAFSKIVYDKTLIPEWTNEVGEAIGVRGGGDVRNAAAVITSGSMQSGVFEIINMTVQQTKEFMGATDAALGEVDPDNTSAILALQESSAVPLETVRQNLYACIEEVALIWADMVFEYYPKGRLVLCRDKDGNTAAEPMPDITACRGSLICAGVDVGAGTRYSQVVSLNTLDKLLGDGYITFEQYLKRLPDGIINDKEEIIEYVKNKVSAENGKGTGSVSEQLPVG